MRVAVLGAGGTIGPAIVRDLAESDEFEEVFALDRDGERVRAVADAHGLGKTPAAAVDAEDRMALMLVLEGVGLLVNAASYRSNLGAMEACLAAGCGYVDLGGLYHMTERQLALHEAFAVDGLLAVIGCGAAPGKTNVMAARAAAELNRVDAIRCASAGVDLDPPAGFSTPYAVETLLDEVTLEPMVVRSGAPVAVPPLTDGGRIAFPDPIGERDSIYTLHSEVLTLPGSLGAPECDFRLSLTPAVHEALVARAEAPVEPGVGERPLPPSARTWSAQRVDVAGLQDDQPVCVTVTALTGPHERWGLGGGIVSTGSVAAATARLYARGALGAVAGVLPPEAVLTPAALFGELEPRGCTFSMTVEARD